MSPRQSKSPKWLITSAKWLLVALLAWGVHRTALAAVGQLNEQLWDPFALRPGWIVAAACLYLAALLPSALFWHRLLWTLGQRPRLGETLRAYYIGHLGKYVPGKAMVVILRAGLIRSTRVGTAAASASVFYETLTMMGAGAFVSAAILTIGFPEHWMLALVALALAALTGLPTLPPVLGRLVKLVRLGSIDPGVVEQLDRLGYRTLGSGWLLVGCGWVLAGLSLWATLQAGGYGGRLERIEEIAFCTAAAGLAVVLGFLSPIPGGLVVREAVLLGLLAPVCGEAGALVAPLMARLEWLVAEGLISSILYPMRCGRGKNETGHA